MLPPFPSLVKLLTRKHPPSLPQLQHLTAPPTCLTLHPLITNNLPSMMSLLTLSTLPMMMPQTRLKIPLPISLTMGLPIVLFPMAHPHPHPLSIQPLLALLIDILPLLSMFLLSALLLTSWTFRMMKITHPCFALKIFIPLQI